MRLIAVGAIFLVAIPNYLGVRQGSTTQNIFAYGKIAAVIIVAVCGFVIGKGSTAHFQPFFSDSVTGLTTATIVAALVAVMWTYDGWCDVTPIVGEMKNPGKDMVRTLAIGMGSVIVLYIFMNFVYVYLVPLPEMAGLAGSDEMIATAASRNIFGAAGVSLIAALILVSTFGGLNGNMMAAPRVFFAMARDGYFFKKVGEIHPRFGTPYLAIVTTFVMASIYVLSGTFEQIINYFIFVSWIFYMLNVAGVILMRRKHPEMQRPYKTWGYPVVPILFIVAGTFMVINIFIENPLRSGLGVLLMLCGIPIYFIWKKSTPKK